MTDEQINIAIAQLCGVNYYKPTEAEIATGSYYQYEPDYANDLNVMQSALSLLNTDELSRQFMFNLYAVLDEKYEAFEYATGEPVITAFYLLQAKPREWAEAFLRTFGKWID